MTWQEARSQAAAWVESLLARSPCPQPGDEIRLTEFEDEACHDFLKPEDRWTLTFHRMVAKAAARDLRKRGLIVRIVTIRVADYWRWLEDSGRRNCADSRAAYIDSRS